MFTSLDAASWADIVPYIDRDGITLRPDMVLFRLDINPFFSDGLLSRHSSDRVHVLLRIQVSVAHYSHVRVDEPSPGVASAVEPDLRVNLLASTRVRWS